MRKIIEGDVDLADLHLTELSGCNLSDVEVTGNYHCSDNNLTSLAGCPLTVDGSFYCKSRMCYGDK